ncbi:MAG: 2Fe-2S iron-sulfur cluster binding domain-containing protein [Deltaproteobacteria bacterium]|nr:2Fe-2S iron-sulfur cluster binding domain-containing protein [Deltaproteobacteria bacterium]
MVFFLPILVFGGLLVGLTVALTFAEKVLVNYGICKIDINAGERELEVEGGQSLLSALNESKVFIPSACGGRGSCGHCRATVFEGGGPVLPTETPFLTRAQVRAKVRLACQVKVREDIRMKIPEELLNVKMFTAHVSSARLLTHDMVETRFALEEPEEISFRPGQYVQLQAPSPEGPIYRAYSVSSPCSKTREVELVVRLVPGGIGSTYAHNLEVNDPIIFTGPYGEFRISEDPDVGIILVGGGSGMAPIKNIVYTVCERWPERECLLFFGCRTTKDVFYREEFNELASKHPNLKVVFALSDPVEEGDVWDGERGFIHLSVDQHVTSNVKRQAFLCGPPPMIEAVMKILGEKGLAPEDMFYDEF